MMTNLEADSAIPAKPAPFGYRSARALSAAERGRNPHHSESRPGRDCWKCVRLSARRTRKRATALCCDIRFLVVIPSAAEGSGREEEASAVARTIARPRPTWTVSVSTGTESVTEGQASGCLSAAGRFLDCARNDKKGSPRRLVVRVINERGPRHHVVGTLDGLLVVVPQGVIFHALTRAPRIEDARLDCHPERSRGIWTRRRRVRRRADNRPSVPHMDGIHIRGHSVLGRRPSIRIASGRRQIPRLRSE